MSSFVSSQLKGVCVCVCGVSHKTQFPFYQFIKQAKQILYGDWYKPIHSDYCCFVDSTCHQPVMAASSLQELAAMRYLATCELDKRRHLVTDVRTSKRHLD